MNLETLRVFAFLGRTLEAMLDLYPVDFPGVGTENLVRGDGVRWLC